MALTKVDSGVVNQLASANMPTGSVLQVVNSANNTLVTTSSLTLTDTGLTASITPKFATSAILIMVTLTGVSFNATNGIYPFVVTDGSNNIVGYITNWSPLSTAASNIAPGYSVIFRTTPSTTSSITYKVRYAATNGGITRLNDYQATPAPYSTITLMEIAG